MNRFEWMDIRFRSRIEWGRYFNKVQKDRLSPKTSGKIGDRES